MRIFTIGFTKSSAEHFFGRLKKAGVRNILDVRLNNLSQLAGFAKRDDWPTSPGPSAASATSICLRGPHPGILDSSRRNAANGPTTSGASWP